MAYRRFNRSYSKPKPRTLTVKYPGTCMACGALIKAGEIATYYPAGTIAGVTEGKIAHVGGLDGNSGRCAANNRAYYEAKIINDYAGDGLDARYEDDCARMCGL